MHERYIENLSQEQRAAWAFPIFIRLWLSGMCRSGRVAEWTISELAVIFEITQAFLFADKPHTQNSLVRELGLTKQTVTRQVLKFEERGIIRQETSSEDARCKYLYPADFFFTRDAMTKIAGQFAGEWLHGFEHLDKARNARWYPRMDNCSNQTAKRCTEKFEELAQAS